MAKKEESDEDEGGHSIETLEREPFMAENEREHNTYGLSFVKGYSFLKRDWYFFKKRLVFYCRTTSASTAPCTSRRMCCPTHCANNCAPCQPLVRAFSGWMGAHHSC